MILALAASLAIANPTTLDAADVVGVYVTSQREVAGALELRPDGRFRYRLDYGAVSESAEGDWKLKVSTVELTSNPMPKAPDFTLVRHDPAPPGELYVELEDSAFRWSPIDVLVSIQGEEQPLLTHAEDDGKVIIPAGRHATSVRVMVPVYDVAGSPVELRGGSGHRLRFRLQPNDLGRASFRAEPLVVDGSSIILGRYDAEIVFRRASQ